MTYRRTILSVLCLAALLLPGALLAQGGPPVDAPSWDGERGGMRGPGGHAAHRISRLARVLELTEEQRAATRTLLEEHRAANEPLRTEQRAAREHLHALLQEDSPNATTVGEAVLEAHALGAQIRASFETLMEDFRALLTQEQQERLDEILEMRAAFREDRGERRRGHRGGPGRGV